MVVDDEPMVLRMMAYALQQAGYTVHKASNGPDALALAEGLGKTLDLVVTDVHMEPIGGPELASLLYSRGLAARFLFVSRYGPAPDYNDQFGPLLPKPFSPDRLLEEVANVLT